MEEGYQQPTSEIYSGKRYDIDSSVHKWLFNPKEVMQEIERYLRGQVYDRKLHKWITHRKPVGNDDFINALLSFVHPYTTKLFSMSDFSDEVINKMAHVFEINLVIFLGTCNINEYRFDEDKLSMLKDQLGDMVYATLRKANQGLSLGVFRDTIEKREVVQSGNKGGFSIFKKFKGGG